jgi:uncharacterized membrane protein
MIALYTTLKFVHILLAIIAVGFNASYGVWLSRAAQNPPAAGILLRGVKLMDDRFANPAYGLLLITGLAMVFTAGIPLTTFWVAAASILWLIAVIWGLAMYTPILRRQIQTLDAKGFDSPEYQQLSRRATTIGLVNMVPILLILILMVFKPTL